MTRPLALFFAFAALFALATGTVRADESVRLANPGKARGDVIIESSIADATNLIPPLSTDGASHDIAGYVYNGLVSYDKNLKMEGELAESWDISPDQKTITFHLRDDVRWHDGTPFTAADVAFTYRLMIDNETPTPYDEDFRQVSSLEVVDDYTVRVHYDEPYAPALNGWGLWMLPKHLLEGVKVTESPLARNPVGTGPFTFGEWKPGVSISVKANPDYFKGRPNLDGVLTRIIPDSATTFLELLSGNIDIMSLDALQYTKHTANPRFKNQYDRYKYLASSYVYVGYNLQNPMFKDKRVRQALTYATPKQKIIDGLLFGLGKPATGPYKPGSFYYNPDVKRYPYDPDKALELFSQAGWTDSDGDGVLDRDGQPFAFTIITNQGNTTRARIAEILQQEWKKVGVRVDIRILEWATFINEYINKKNFEATILGWNILVEPDLFDVWHSSTCGKSLNFICYGDPVVDEMIEKGRRIYDPEERKPYYDKLQEVLAEQQPYTFLYVPEALVALHKRFRAIEPAPAGLTHNFIEWYVPTELQKYHFMQ